MGGAGGGVIVHLKVPEGEYVIVVVVSVIEMVIGFDLHLKRLQNDLGKVMEMVLGFRWWRR